MAVVVTNTNRTQQSSGNEVHTSLSGASHTANAGSLYCLLLWNYSSAYDVATVTDDKNGSWTRALINGASNSLTTAAPSPGFAMAAYYIKNAAAGTTIITATWASGGTQRKGAYLFEVSGLTGGGDLDQCIGAAYNASAATTLEAGTFATFAQTEVGCAQVILCDNVAPSIISGWTASTDLDAFYYERGGTRVSSSSTGFQAGYTASSSSKNAITVAVAFKDLGGGGGGGVPRVTGKQMSGGFFDLTGGTS